MLKILFQVKYKNSVLLPVSTVNVVVVVVTVVVVVVVVVTLAYFNFKPFTLLIQLGRQTDCLKFQSTESYNVKGLKLKKACVTTTTTATTTVTCLFLYFIRAIFMAIFGILLEIKF